MYVAVGRSRLVTTSQIRHQGWQRSLLDYRERQYYVETGWTLDQRRTRNDDQRWLLKTGDLSIGKDSTFADLESGLERNLFKQEDKTLKRRRRKTNHHRLGY